MYDLGIIGGMGPEATVNFFKRVIEYTDSNIDQEHMNICVMNKSLIPDRSRFLMSKGESPLKYLQECVNDLQLLGIKYIAMPCNTSHYFLKELKVSEKTIFIDMIKETLLVAKELYPCRSIYILGTTGTQKERLYSQYKNIGISESRIHYPNDNEQEILMEIINDIKRGAKDVDVSKTLSEYVMEINSKYDNSVIVLACTELSLYKSILLEKSIVIDAMDILAISSIKNCGV